MLLDNIRSLREQGSHVIVVAHSQGNLLIQQALQSLIPVPGDSTFLGVLALAAPTSSGWTLDDNHLLSITVGGDLVPNAGFSTWERMDTPLSHVASSALSAVSFNLVHYLQEFVKWGLTLHAVDVSYFGQPEVQARIRGDLIQLYHEATVGAVQCAFARGNDVSRSWAGDWQSTCRLRIANGAHWREESSPGQAPIRRC